VPRKRGEGEGEATKQRKKEKQKGEARFLQTGAVKERTPLWVFVGLNLSIPSEQNKYSHMAESEGTRTPQLPKDKTTERRRERKEKLQLIIKRDNEERENEKTRKRRIFIGIFRSGEVGPKAKKGRTRTRTRRGEVWTPFFRSTGYSHIAGGSLIFPLFCCRQNGK